MEPTKITPNHTETDTKDSSVTVSDSSRSPCQDIFIGGLPRNFNLDSLESYLRGEVSSEFQLIEGGEGCKKKKFRGYVVVKGISEVEAENLLKERERKVGGVEILLKPFFTGERLKQHKKSQKPRKIWVKGLSPSWTTPKLREFLSHFGPLEEACVITETENNLCRGCGYGVFEKEQTAMDCTELGELKVGEEKIWVTKYEDRYRLPFKAKTSILKMKKKNLQTRRRRQKRQNKRNLKKVHNLHGSRPREFLPLIDQSLGRIRNQVPQNRRKIQKIAIPLNEILTTKQYAELGWQVETHGYQLNIRLRNDWDNQKLYLPAENRVYNVSVGAKSQVLRSQNRHF